jgi:hypothetical protein
VSSTQYNPQVTVKASAASEGSNITIIVKGWQGVKASELASIGIHVFLIDPDGIVEVESIQGDTPTVSSYNNGVGYELSRPIYGDLTLSNGFAQKGMLYTFAIPNDQLSIGTWRVLVFVTGVGTPAADTNISGSSAASFNVMNSSSASTIVQTASGVFGIGGGIYRVETFVIGRERIVGSTREFLRRNAWTIAIIVLIAIYIYSIYYPL